MMHQQENLDRQALCIMEHDELKRVTKGRKELRRDENKVDFNMRRLEMNPQKNKIKMMKEDGYAE